MEINLLSKGAKGKRGGKGKGGYEKGGKGKGSYDKGKGKGKVLRKAARASLSKAMTTVPRDNRRASRSWIPTFAVIA